MRTLATIAALAAAPATATTQAENACAMWELQLARAELHALDAGKALEAIEDMEATGGKAEAEERSAALVTALEDDARDFRALHARVCR